MIDIDAEFMRSIGLSTNTSAQTVADEPLTMAKLEAVMQKMRDMPPPPPPIYVTKAAMGLPTGEPRTDYMREMVARVGRVRVPACYRISGPAGDSIMVHPDLLDKYVSGGYD